MTSINEVYDYLCELAPLSLQMEFDNSGFQVGRGKAPVRRALLALDVTDDVVEEAISLGAELIVSHHPLIFNAPKCISDADPGTGSQLTGHLDDILTAGEVNVIGSTVGFGITGDIHGTGDIDFVVMVISAAIDTAAAAAGSVFLHRAVVEDNDAVRPDTAAVACGLVAGNGHAVQFQRIYVGDDTAAVAGVVAAGDPAVFGTA